MTVVSSHTSFVVLLAVLLTTCFGTVEASNLLRRGNGSKDQTALSPAVVEVVVIGLGECIAVGFPRRLFMPSHLPALFASCLLSLYLYRRYRPTNPVLPLYTLPAPRYRVQNGIRIRSERIHRLRRPAQGASPTSSRPFFSRVPASSEEGMAMVSVRSMPTAHIKTKVAFPTAGAAPPVRKDNTTALDNPAY